MKYNRKDLEKNKVEISVTISPDEIKKHHANAVKKLARDVKVDGFRKGHIPPEVAEKHINPANLADEAVNSAVNSALIEMIEKEDLQVLDQPEISVTKFVPAQILEFTAVLEIVPPIKLADPTKLKTKKEEVKIDDKEIDEILQRLRQNSSAKEETKRAAKNGDEVIIDFTGYFADEKTGKTGEKFDGGAAKDYALSLGSNSFIPGFEEAIIDHKAGDEFDIPLSFPEDYGAENLAGKKVIFKIVLHKVNEVKLPELNDKFASTISPEFKKLDDLKNDIKRELTARAEQDNERKFQDDLLKELAEKSNVEAPEILVNDQLSALERDFTQNLMYRGLDLEGYLKQEKLSRDEWIKRDVIPAAEKRVQNSLIITQLSRDWKITATNEEIESQRQKILAQYTEPTIRANFETDEARRQIAQQIITEKTLEKLAKLSSK